MVWEFFQNGIGCFKALFVLFGFIGFLQEYKQGKLSQAPQKQVNPHPQLSHRTNSTSIAFRIPNNQDDKNRITQSSKHTFVFHIEKTKHQKTQLT